MRYCLTYRSAHGTPVFLTALRKDTLAVILARQKELRSQSFLTAEDTLPWFYPERDRAIQARFADPARPTWEECVLAINSLNARSQS